MTTKVTIDPANHTVEVQIIDGLPGNATVTTELIDPGAPPRDYWIHSTRSIVVSETSPRA